MVTGKHYRFLFYVLTIFLALAAFFGQAPPVSAANQVAANSALNLRSGPSTNYKILEKVSAGSKLTVITSSKGWYNVSTIKGVKGWVAGWLVAQVKAANTNTGSNSSPSKPAAVTVAKTLVVTGTTVNVRSGPATTYTKVAIVKKGEQYQASKLQLDWYYIKLTNGKYGWLSKTFVQEKTEPSRGGTTSIPTKFDKKVFITGSTVNIRTGPSTSSAITVQAVQYDEFGYIAEKDGWYNIALSPTKIGWVSKTLAKLTAYNESLYKVTEVTTDVYDDHKISFILTGNGAINYKKTVLTEPNRLVLELKGFDAAQEAGSYNIEHGLLTGYSLIQASSAPSVAKLTLNLSSKCGYTIGLSPDKQTLTVVVSDGLLSTKKIVLDAGHGDFDPGAIGGNGLKEKDVNLDIATRLAEYLRAFGADVTLTRSDDTFVTLTNRAKAANELGADIFISIHANSNTNNTVGGTSTYYYAPSTRPDLYAQAEERRKLAQAVQDEMVKAVGRRNIGILTNQLAVLSGTQMPSILVETAFVSNPEEEALLNDPVIRDKFAQAISQGILNYFSSQN